MAHRRVRYRGTITQIPASLRAELDQALINRNFSDYSELTVWLNDRLAGEGLELTLSRTSVHRYGKRFEERVEMLELATRQAERLKGLFTDESANLSEMALQLCQGLMFNLMIESGEKLAPKELSMMTRSLAEATRDRGVSARRRSPKSSNKSWGLPAYETQSPRLFPALPGALARQQIPAENLGEVPAGRRNLRAELRGRARRGDRPWGRGCVVFLG
jgi:hypothetical protein